MKKLFAMLLALAMLVPAACAVTKDDIKAELGVFRLDELEHVESIKMLPDDDCPKAVLTMAEKYIIIKGSDMSDDVWFTSEGVMCEADVDLDGDGSKEYIVAYAQMSDEKYPGPELRLRVYARDGEEYSLKGDLPLHWYWDNELHQSYISIAPQKKGAVIFSGGISASDGAGSYASVFVYGYDGENCNTLLAGNASNFGPYLVIRNVYHPEILESFREFSAYELMENPRYEDYDFDANDESEAYIDHGLYGPTADEGFDCINENLEKFGVELHTAEFINGDWGCLTATGFTGGRDFQTTSSNEDHCTLTLGMSGPLAEAQMEGLETWTPSLSDDLWWEIIPDSDTRKLTKAELSGCDSELLGYIRNEILARHGYPFTKEKYQTYFGSKRWYEISEDFDYSRLSEIETANIALIQSLE